MAEVATAVAAADDSDENQSDGTNVEQRLSKLEKILTETAKSLDEERKASAGKDKKITELANKKRELEQATLSKDKLLELREKEQQERENEWNSRQETERKELERLKIEVERNRVIAKLENFPAFLADRVKGSTPDEIEADAREIMKKWVKERDKVDNVRKVTGKPQSGNGKQVNISADDVRAMTPKQKMEWAKAAGDEEFDSVFDDLHSE